MEQKEQKEAWFFPEEAETNERELLAKKAEWYLHCENLPKGVIKPAGLLEDRQGNVVGYHYEKPDFPFLTLKELFQKENVERYHIDGHLLFSLARKVLYLLMELSENNIYPGFIDLSSILVHEKRPDKDVIFRGVEHFQADTMPSTFPWYPSDSRLFDADFSLFDAESQKKADAKLIYKILTLSGKGNARIPPNPKNQEVSYLFWNILSREWKDFFLNLPGEKVNYQEIMGLLLASIEEETYYTDPGERKMTEEVSAPPQKPAGGKKAYAMIVVLREAGKSAHDISRWLYLLQDRLSEDNEYVYEQAFILGDRHVFARDFALYPKDFRSQLAHSIKSYSFGEAILIGCELLSDALSREARDSFLYILLDGEIKNDAMFGQSLIRLEQLKVLKNTHITVFSARENRGEGYARLMELAE